MNVMSMRVFLRGGYKTIREPTVVSSHGRPIFTVLPNATYITAATKPQEGTRK